MENAYEHRSKLAPCQKPAGLAGQGAGVFGRRAGARFAAAAAPSCARAVQRTQPSARMVQWI